MKKMTKLTFEQIEKLREEVTRAFIVLNCFLLEYYFRDLRKMI